MSEKKFGGYKRFLSRLKSVNLMLVFKVIMHAKDLTDVLCIPTKKKILYIHGLKSAAYIKVLSLLFIFHETFFFGLLLLNETKHDRYTISFWLLENPKFILRGEIACVIT